MARCAFLPLYLSDPAGAVCLPLLPVSSCCASQLLKLTGCYTPSHAFHARTATQGVIANIIMLLLVSCKQVVLRLPACNPRSLADGQTALVDWCSCLLMPKTWLTWLMDHQSALRSIEDVLSGLVWSWLTTHACNDAGQNVRFELPGSEVLQRLLHMPRDLLHVLETPSSFRSTQGQLDLGMCSKHRHSVVLCHVKIDSGTDLHTFGRRPAFCAFWPCKAPEGPAKDPCQSKTFARPQSAVSEHFSSCRHQC